MSKLISVIVPFYNVENYIEKCIHSLQQQNYSNFECFLIDDESPDHSFDKASIAIEQDPRFSIIRQKNKGLGGARNTGIEYAKGDYIFFLDSDDYLKPNALERLVETAEQTQADIVVCSYDAVDEHGKTLYIKHQFNQGCYANKEEILEKFLYYPTAWNKLYKRELWKQIRYPEKLYFEDLATTYKLIPELHKIYALNEPLYCYLQRAGSIMTSYKPKNIEDRFIVFEALEKDLYQQDYNREDLKKILTSIYLSHLVYTSLGNIASSQLSFKEKLVLFNQLKQRLNKEYLNLEGIEQSKSHLSKFEYILTRIYHCSPLLALLANLVKNKIKTLR